MKTIIAGMRDFDDYRPVMRAIKKAALIGITIDELVCGMAPGVDTTGYFFAKMARIPIKEFPADWDGKGNAAGPIRNQQMAEYADALIAVWDGNSKGTRDMINRMVNCRNKLIFIYGI
jgi:YspA, cpYpsA-related SLOG family